MNYMDKKLIFRFKNICLLISLIIFFGQLSACSNSGDIASNQSVITATPVNNTKPTISTATFSAESTLIPLTSTISPTVTQITENNSKNIPGLTQEIEKRWLNGNSCLPPCWEGILPGKTTAQDALKLLEKFHGITNINISNSTFFKTGEPSSGEIIWKWINSEASGAINLNTSTPKTPLMVSSIIPFIISPTKPFYPEYKFKDIVNALGEPNSVKAELGFIDQENPAPDKLTYTIHFFYLKKGVLISSYNEKKPILNYELLVTGPIFFIPDNVQSIGVLGKSKNILPWQGFQTFDFYCRESSSAKCNY